ncbi:ComEC/Rec2 family competence protein [Dongia sp.]|uniref:ComEC/Rec2 family competence protein n=1 Tax=Dongia sp. TaxID=1977262 RepID=UPI0035AE78CF
MSDGLWQRVEDFVAGQRANWPGWAAVALGTGIALYFGLPFEPPLWVGPSAALLLAILAFAVRRWPLPMIAALYLVAISVGFSVVSLRTTWVEAPQLARSLYRAEVTGRIVEVELFPGSQRVTLDQLTITSEKTGPLGPEQRPERVRVKLSKVNEPIGIGDWIGLTADLQPPAPPVAPGAFDFRRQAYFERLGGVGFSLQPAIKISPPVGQEAALGWLDWFDSLRLTIGRRIQAELPGATGAMAMALIVGNQTALRADDVNAMRDSGLAHLTSISGLHIGLAAGIFFFGLRALLALVPPIALRFDIKKWAAVLALIGAFFYAGLAGMPVPTERALVMTGIFFCAILLDRSPISMRVIAFAAIVVLLLSPEALIGASFQMSFAAVLGLVRAFDGGRAQFARLRRIGRDAPDMTGRVLGMFERGFVWLGTLMLTSLIASLMTAPFAAYHFNRLTLFGIAANMLAVPLTGFWIMPLAVLALVAMPFGLEHWPLVLMGWGCDLILDIAHWVGGWPGAVVLLPAIPVAGLMLMSLGLIWFCLVIGRAKWLAAPILILGLLSPFTLPAPDILAFAGGRTSRLVAVRNEAGDYQFSSTRAANIAAETWLRRNAQAKRLPFPAPLTVAIPLNSHQRLLDAMHAAPLSAASGSGVCNADWCRFDTRMGYVAVALNADGLAPACHTARLVISLEPVAEYCPSAERVIDFFDMWRHGTHAIAIHEDGSFSVRRSYDTGNRPWTLDRFGKPAQPESAAPDSGLNTGASGQSDDPGS